MAATGGSGVIASSQTMSHSVALDLDRVTVSGAGGNGIFADGSGAGTVVVRVSNCTVVENALYGLNQTSAATLGSLKNNLVAGNGLADTNGAITTITVH